MSLWSAAENSIRMADASLQALKIFDTLSISGAPNEALLVIRAVVIALIEGYQGRISGDRLQTGLRLLDEQLRVASGIPDTDMIEVFRSAL